MKKRLCTIIMLCLILNLVIISNAYAVTSTSTTPYYADTSTPSTSVDSGSILWADPANTTATLETVVFGYSVQSGDSLFFDFYDSTGNLIYESTYTNSSLGGSLSNISTNYSPNNGLKLRMVSSALSGDRNFYIQSVTNSWGNTTIFPAPDITPPAPPPDPTCTL